MEYVRVERLDHLGVVASVIKDLGLIEMIDARLLLHDQAEITAGEAIAGMILNGLGFSNRPLSLTPQFFANKPLDLLFREGLRAEMFNRFNADFRGRKLTHIGLESRVLKSDREIVQPWNRWAFFIQGGFAQDRIVRPLVEVYDKAVSVHFEQASGFHKRAIELFGP